MSKRVVLGLLIFVLCAMSVSAIEFEATLNSTQASTRIGEAATYTLTISHDSGTSERFDIFSPDVEWDITTSPLRPVNVERGVAQDVILSVRPLYANPGYYAITLHVRHAASGESIKKTLIIGVQPKDYVPGQYVPAVRLYPHVDRQIDPRDEAVITINVTNGNPRDLTNVSIKVRSNLLNTEATIDLNGLEKKQLVFPLKLPKLTPPQKDVLEVTALVRDGLDIIPFTAEPIEFEVIEYGEISQNVAEVSGFLKSTKTYTLTNTGNAKKSTEFALKTTFLKSWFTTSEPAPKNIRKDDGSYDAWDITLGVGESTSITLVTNYRPLALVLIVLFLSIGAYYVFRSPLVVRKSAVVIAAKEGGMSELKVLIEVSNRSSRPVKLVDVLDKVPHIATIEKEFEIGTMRPAKVTPLPSKGTLIKWTFEELDAGEERVMSYRIQCKLSVLGQMRLPIAVTKFTTSHGNHRRTKSNISQIGFGQ
ncbi:hypothetical protein HY492_00390 [Candidatus Woesearchaeota archaeon]|nr:hypothetical protein [Candidatus Woesearchaeota archaeon]